MSKILYFEGAGMAEAETSKNTIGNCRIRTAFRLDDGQAVYLEILGNKVSPNNRKMRVNGVNRYAWEYTGYVDSCHYIVDFTSTNDCNNNRILTPDDDTVYLQDRMPRRTFEYSERDILRFVNSLGASFNGIQVVNDLGGYRVFKEDPPRGSCIYNFQEDFTYDPALIERRKAVHDVVYRIEKAEREEDLRSKGGKFVHSPLGHTYPNFSLWVDRTRTDQLHLMRHYNGHNRHWLITIGDDGTAEDWVNCAAECQLGKYGC